MRITILSPPPNWSGGERVIAIYAKHLSNRGHSVDIVCNRFPKGSIPHRLAVFFGLKPRSWKDERVGSHYESYNVAFNEGTDNRYCKQYDIFKNTPDGVFIDKLSGEVLFDTRNRFNSGTGWLSFYKAEDGSTIEKVDNSYGMQRTEVIAKKSGIHLGHVFPWEGGKRRFCINATVLDFVPRDKVK